eukprot:247253_1
MRKHSLLYQSKYEHKTVLHRLIDELQVLHRLVDELHLNKTILLNDNDAKIKYLFYRLITEKQRINDDNTFWKNVGFKINDYDHDIISYMRKHSLLSQSKCKYRTVLHRLVDELNFNKIVLETMVEELKLNDKLSKIEYLFYRLITEAQRISDENAFWKKARFKINDIQYYDEMISSIATHPLLLENSKYENKTVLYRLVHELRIINLPNLLHQINQHSKCEFVNILFNGLK